MPEDSEKIDLTEKQEQFCHEWLIDFNATQAAVRAGYSKDTAYAIGWENLRKPEIKARIAELRKDIDTRNNNLTQRIIDELSKIGFSNIQDFIDGGNEITDLTEIDREQASAVSSVKRSITEFGTDENGGTKTVVEMKLHDKLAALEKLGRITGIFEADNKQRSPVVIRVTDEEDE